MRIESIRIRGFGCLVERVYNFPEDRAVLVLEDNESGKSTLAAAILAALCGFPKRKASGEKVKLRDVYEPWDSEIYALEMDISAGSKKLRIERDFAKDSFTVRERDTNKDISAQYNFDLTHSVLHLPREDFQRIAFISGKEVSSFTASDNLKSRLSSLVEGSSDGNGTDKAIAALENARYKLDGKSIQSGTAVTRISKEIEEKKTSLDRLDAALDSAGNEVRRLDAAQSRLEELAGIIKDLDCAYLAARLREAREQIKSVEANNSEAAKLKQELNELETYSAFPAERGSQLSRAATRIAERKQQLREREAELRSLQQEEDNLKLRLKETERFNGASDEDVISLGTSESAITESWTNLDRKREEIELEKRALKAEGIDLNSTLDERQKYQPLTDTEREFIRSYRESELHNTAEQHKIEVQSSQTLTGLQSIEQKRASLRRSGIALLSIGGIVALASVGLMILQIIKVPISVAITIAGALAVLAGAGKYMKASSIDADAKAKLEREREEVQSALQVLLSQRHEDQVKLNGIAKSLNIADSEKLVDAFRECERSLNRAKKLESLHSQLEQIEESNRATVERALRQLAGFGITCDPEDAATALKRAKDNLVKHLNDRKKLQDIEKQALNTARELEDLNTRLRDEEQVAISVLADAGVDKSIPLDEALKQFEALGKQYQRYREIKDVLLPAAQKHTASAETIDKLKTEEADLDSQLAGYAIPTNTKASSEIEAERQSARSEADRVINEIRELERSVGTCVENYRREYPQLQERLQDLERELKRVTNFERSVGLAACVMREVTQDTHRRWALALNEQASLILPHLNPDYDTLRFDDSLDFTLRHVSDSRIVEKCDVDTRLSTGAKDQVYLAVRLACCRELSFLGESIPIILDDPLMAADDGRFAEGLRYLVTELSKEHQVIILSCHKSRHDSLREYDWFSENAAVLEL